MPQFTSAELRAHVQRARSEARQVACSQLAGGYNADLGLTLPVGGVASRRLLDAVTAADAKSHGDIAEGKLAAPLFLAELRSNGLELSRDEGEALCLAFGDWQRDVNYGKWWRSLGLEQPEDYVNPSLHVDPLPQPYRTVLKVLEQDILDAAWATLETKYPELILEGCSRPPGPLKELENLAMPTGTDGDQGDHSHLLLGAITCVRAVGGLYSSDLTNSGAGSGNGSSPASRVGFGADGYGLGTAADWSLCGSADGTLSVVSSGSSAAAGGEGSGPCRLLSSRSLSDLLRHDCSDWLSAQLDPHVVAGNNSAHPRGVTLLSEVAHRGGGSSLSSSSSQHPLRVAVALADLSQAPSTPQPPSHFPASSSSLSSASDTAAAAAAGDGDGTSSDAVLTTIVVLELWPVPSGKEEVADVWPARAPPQPMSSRSQLIGSAPHSDRSHHTGTNKSSNDGGGGVSGGAGGASLATATGAAAAAVPDLNLPDALPFQGGGRGEATLQSSSSSSLGPRFTVCCVGTLSGLAPAAGLSLSADGLYLGVSMADGAAHMYVLPPRPPLLPEGSNKESNLGMSKIDEDDDEQDALETTSIGGDPSNRETNGAAASAGSKSQRQGAGKGKGKGGSSSDGRNEPTLLLPPLFVLPPPPPPPAYLDDIEAAKTATAAEAAAAKAAAVAVAENKEEGGVPAASASPSSSSSPSPSSFRWHASLVARIAFLQGAGRDGGVGAATVGPSANRISTASAIVWRPASNVLRKFMLPTEAVARRWALAARASSHAASEEAAALAAAAAAEADSGAAAAGGKSAPPKGGAKNNGKGEGAPAADGDEEGAAAAAAAVAKGRADELRISRMACDRAVSLGWEMTLGSAVTCIAMSLAPASGLGQGAQLLGIAAIGLASGSVVLMDLSAGCLLTSLGSHHTTITALTFAWVPSSSFSSSSLNVPPTREGSAGGAHQQHSGAGDADAPIFQPEINEGSLRLVSGSADGVMHVYALAPPDASSSSSSLLVPKNSSHGRNHNGSRDINHSSHSKQPFFPTLGAATALPALQNGGSGEANAGFGPLSSIPPSPATEDMGLSSSSAPLIPGCLPPKLLFSVQHLERPLVWLGCSRDLSLFLCQVEGGPLMVYDLDDATLLGVLGFPTDIEPLQFPPALNPMYGQPLSAPSPFGVPTMTAATANTSSTAGNTSVSGVPMLACGASSVLVACSTPSLRAYGQHNKPNSSDSNNENNGDESGSSGGDGGNDGNGCNSNAAGSNDSAKAPAEDIKIPAKMDLPPAALCAYPFALIARQLCPGVAATADALAQGNNNNLGMNLATWGGVGNAAGGNSNNSSASLSASRVAWRGLSPAQRRDKNLDPWSVGPAAGGGLMAQNQQAQRRLQHGSSGSATANGQGGPLSPLSTASQQHRRAINANTAMMATARSSTNHSHRTTTAAAGAGGGSGALTSAHSERGGSPERRTSSPSEGKGHHNAAAAAAAAGMPMANEEEIAGLGYNTRYLPPSAYALREVLASEATRAERQKKLLSRRAELLSKMPA